MLDGLTFRLSCQEFHFERAPDEILRPLRILKSTTASHTWPPLSKGTSFSYRSPPTIWYNEPYQSYPGQYSLIDTHLTSWRLFRLFRHVHNQIRKILPPCNWTRFTPFPCLSLIYPHPATSSEQIYNFIINRGSLHAVACLFHFVNETCCCLLLFYNVLKWSSPEQFEFLSLILGQSVK